MPQENSPTILCIGASDSSATTGIQMDVKTAQSFGCQVKTVVTCLYARSQSGVKSRHVVPIDFIKDELALALEDDEIRAVKVGDLCNREIINVVADLVDELSERGVKIVVDPVLTTICGTFQMSPEERAEFRRRLPLRADVFTPSLQEGELLSGMDVTNLDELEMLADTLRTFGAKSVVLRGGKLEREEKIMDVVVTDDAKQVFETTLSLEKYGARGVGAATATGIACGLAKGHSVQVSIEKARRFVDEAMRAAKTSTTKTGGTMAVDPIDAMKRLYELGL